MCPISKNVLHQEFFNAFKIFLECFYLVESTIAAPELAYKIYKRRKLVGIKMATNGHFCTLSESPPVRVEILTFPNWLKVSSITFLRSRCKISMSSGCKISMKNAIWGVQNGSICNFGLTTVILAPFRVSSRVERKF